MARHRSVVSTVVLLVCLSACGGAPPQPGTAGPSTPFAPTAAATAAQPARTLPAATTAAAAGPTVAGTPRPAANLPYADDFSNPKSGWPVGTFNKDTVDFRGGKYHILIGQENFLRAAWLTDFNVADVSVEADASIDGGPADGMVGVVCRVDTTRNSYYGFMLGADGRYTIVKVAEGKTSTLSEYFLQPNTIRTPQQSNHIQADCAGDRLTLLVNDQKLIENRDATLSTGSFGMIASTGPSGTSGVDTTFTRISARAAPTAPTPPPAGASTVAPAFSGIAFRDDFSSNATGWVQRDDNDVKTEYVNNAYHVVMNKDNSSVLVRAAQPSSVGDVSVEVVVDSTRGPIENSFGIACRIQDEMNYYRLVIGSDGFFGIAKVKTGENTWLAFHESLSSQINARKSPSDPGTGNTIRGDCIGNRLALFANGRPLDQVVDNEFAGGGVGLRIGTEKAGAEVFFKDFLVRTP